MVADLNFTVEKHKVKEQQTPRVHPFHGFLRDSGRGQVAFLASLWVFLAAYFMGGVWAAGCALTTLPWWVFASLLAAEFTVLVVYKCCQGELASGGDLTDQIKLLPGNAGGSWGASALMTLAYFLTTSTLPLLQFRVSVSRVRIAEVWAHPPLHLPELSTPPRWAGVRSAFASFTAS